MAAGPSPASVDQPAEGRLSPQIWAIAVDAESLAGLDAGKLGRFRALGFNTVLAIGLDRDRLTRLGTLSRRKNLTLVAPRRDSACATEAMCAVEAGSMLEAARLRRRPGLDLVVVRVPGAGALPAMPTGGTRILAVVKLRNRQVDARLWRRAIEKAADSPGIDLAVDPVGRKGEQALSLYLRLLAAGRRGDDEPPSPPRALTASEVTGTTLRLHWGPARDLHGVSSYRLYRDGVAVGRLLALNAPITGLRCGTRYRLEVEAADAVGNRSAKAALGVSTESCTEPLPPLAPSPGGASPGGGSSGGVASGGAAPGAPPLPPPPGSLAVEQMDGGPTPYAAFANPLSSSVAFFPIAVWGSYAHEVANVAEDRAVGISTYVWVADTNASFMQNIRNAGQRVIQDYDNQANLSVTQEGAGWLLGDERDMTQGPSACPSAMDQAKASIANPGGLFTYSNYGKGVIFWQNDAQAACFVNYDNVNSADIYWFTDGNVCGSSSEGPRFYGLEGVRALTQAECRRARNYGDVVQDMRRLDALNGSARHPIWNFVEVGCPFTNDVCIQPAEARAAVWHSLIAGARGVLYFQHSFSGPCQNHHVLRDHDCYQPMIDTITAVNAQIKAIAPALNGPRLSSGFSANANVRAVAKWDGSNVYVLAGSAENIASTGAFSLPCVANATATVLGENRTIPVAAGAFSDSFADGNAVHIYRIDGGTSCGLS